MIGGRGKRAIYMAAGVVFSAVGAVGLVLPLLPGTVFLLLAAFCFARSSPRLEAWLIGHPTLGPPIGRWRATGAIPARAKVIALVSMAVSFAVVAMSGAPPVAIVSTALVMLASAAYVGTRPSR